MTRISKSFVADTLWPEFTELSAALQEHLDRVTDDVIRQAISGDTSEPEEVADLLEGGDS